MKTEHFYPPRNFGCLPSPFADFETAQVVVLPVPYDATTDWHSGSREGPRAIIDASGYLEFYDQELDREIYKVGIHTLNELEPVTSGPEATIERVYEAVKSLIQQKKVPLMLGGEHSISLGAARAFKERFPEVCVLQLDAHADLRQEYLGSKYSHACVMRRIQEICPTVQVGIRSFSAEENQFIKKNSPRIFYGQDSPLSPTAMNRIVSALSEEVYITIDLDVFDPSIMSAVSNPEPGGMTWQEVLALLRQVADHRHIVGFDVVELCPGQGPVACAFLAAKLAYKLIGYATA